ncbi:MAG: L-threonylcarbamoyladenylate synthase [Xanthomonadales bacterium]
MSLVLSIEAAVECLQQGGVVAIPTETVYGLAADASQPQAIKRIFSIKGRPADHPLIVHIARVGQLPDWACDIPDLLEPLAERFWPGPLTVVLKKQAHVSELVTGGQDTIALRIPDHPVALHILSALNRGLCAPSANRFGRVSPTTAQHVIDEPGDDIDGVVDGGACAVGIESTIVDLSAVNGGNGSPSILRPGQISRQELEAYLGLSLAGAARQVPRAPGMLKAHYAPHTPLLLLEKPALDIRLRECLARRLKINLWSTTRPTLRHENILWRPTPGSSKEFAHMVYRQLRRFDRNEADITLIQRPPDLPDWKAVLDRLERAATRFSFE